MPNSCARAQLLCHLSAPCVTEEPHHGIDGFVGFVETAMEIGTWTAELLLSAEQVEVALPEVSKLEGLVIVMPMMVRRKVVGFVVDIMTLESM